MMEWSTTNWELLGVIITLVCGFGGLMYQQGRRSKETEFIAQEMRSAVKGLSEKIVVVDGKIESHEERCKEERGQAREEFGKIHSRISDTRDKLSTEIARNTQAVSGIAGQFDSLLDRAIGSVMKGRGDG